MGNPTLRSRIHFNFFCKIRCESRVICATDHSGDTPKTTDSFLYSSCTHQSTAKKYQKSWSEERAFFGECQKGSKLVHYVVALNSRCEWLRKSENGARSLRWKELRGGGELPGGGHSNQQWRFKHHKFEYFYSICQLPWINPLVQILCFWIDPPASQKKPCLLKKSQPKKLGGRGPRCSHFQGVNSHNQQKKYAPSPKKSAAGK